MFVEIKGNLYNINHITYVQARSSGTIIWFSDGGYTPVDATVKEVQDKIRACTS